MTADGRPRQCGRGRYLIGFFLIWGVLYAAGAAQGAASLRTARARATAAVAALWERLAFGTPRRALLGSLGLGRPTVRSLLAGARGLGRRARLLPALRRSRAAHGLQLRADWLWLAIGLFAYHGLAEELDMARIRLPAASAGPFFGGAIRWTMPLIAITHLPILITNGLAVGIFAIVVAIVTCLPFGYLWERGGQTIWAAAMLHAAIDAFKLLEVPAGQARVIFSLSLGRRQPGGPTERVRVRRSVLR